MHLPHEIGAERTARVEVENQEQLRANRAQLEAELATAQDTDQSDREIHSIASETLHDLTTHDWPGNVRELRKEAEREGLEGISRRYIQDKLSNALASEKGGGVWSVSGTCAAAGAAELFAASTTASGRPAACWPAGSASPGRT